MTRRTPATISAQNYFGPGYNLNIFLEKKDGYEIFYNWSDHLNSLSKGFIYLLKCQPGLTLTITRQSSSADFRISHEEGTNHFVRLFFVLGEAPLIQSGQQEQKITFCSNHGYLTYARNYKSGAMHCPATSFCTVGLLMEPWFVKRFSRKIEEILDLQNKDESFCSPVFMTPSINVRLHEILGCTYIDARRHLFLGSKALELMRCGLDQLNPDKEQNVSCFDLETGSMDFVHKARDIMISDIKNPPSLAKLSQMVGVNRTTLNQCFKKVYGVTVFNYLHRFRLEESKRMLRGGNKSVTQVAFEVGYAQQRTFSREFKKHFGNMPSDYLGKASTLIKTDPLLLT